MFREYFNNILIKKLIQHSVNSAEALVLFVLKNEKNLYLYINYRDFNKITVKNCHSLSLISETLDYLSKAKVLISLNDIIIYLK